MLGGFLGPSSDVNTEWEEGIRNFRRQMLSRPNDDPSFQREVPAVPDAEIPVRMWDEMSGRLEEVARFAFRPPQAVNQFYVSPRMADLMQGHSHETPVMPIQEAQEFNAQVAQVVPTSTEILAPPDLFSPSRRDNRMSLREVASRLRPEVQSTPRESLSRTRRRFFARKIRVLNDVDEWIDLCRSAVMQTNHRSVKTSVTFIADWLSLMDRATAVQVRHHEVFGGGFSLLRNVWEIRLAISHYEDLKIIIDRLSGVIYDHEVLVLKHRQWANVKLNEFLSKASSFPRLVKEQVKGKIGKATEGLKDLYISVDNKHGTILRSLSVYWSVYWYASFIQATIQLGFKFFK